MNESYKKVNNKKLLLSLLLIPLTCAVLAQAVVDYSPTNGLTCSNLKSILHKILIKNKPEEIPYENGKFTADSVLIESDRDPFYSKKVILFYTGWSVNANETWTKEHVWSVSHIDGTYTSTPSIDLHNLKPINARVNSSRSNDDFDNGGKIVNLKDLPITNCLSDIDSWEPRDEDKGDVARIMFYMDVRYEGDDEHPNLELLDAVNSDSVKTGTMFHGKLSTLLKWNQIDSVDDFERNRNEVIYKYQKNRNPFIDHPEFADLIWKCKGNDLILSEPLLAYPNPCQDYVNLIFNGTSPAICRLIKPTGAIVIEFEISGSKRISLSNLPSGIYFLSILAGDKLISKKLIKK
jgi:endonuclease I